MDRTEEKKINIDAIKKLFTENNFLKIFFTDSEDWTPEMKKLLLDLLHYMGKDQEHNLSTAEDRADFLDASNKYLAQIIANIPDEQRADFFNDIDKDNIIVFFDEDEVRQYPDIYTYFMESAFGNEEYEDLFSDEYAYAYSFLKNCPELIETIDSFPTHSEINVEQYYSFVKYLAENVYSNIPVKNKGKAILSYLKNTQYTGISSLNFRKDFFHNFIQDDFIFSEDDYSLIMNETNRLISEEMPDLDFVDIVMNHSTDEFKDEFSKYILDKAISEIKEKSEDIRDGISKKNYEKTIKFYDQFLSRAIFHMDFNALDEKDDVLNFLIDNNMGISLNEALKKCEQEELTPLFEKVVSMDDVLNRPKETIHAFVSNIDFYKYDIGNTNLMKMVAYVAANGDKLTLDELAKKCPAQYKNLIANSIFKVINYIPKDMEQSEKELFLESIINIAEPDSIEKFNSMGLLFQILQYDVSSGKTYSEKCDEIVNKMSFENPFRVNIIKQLLTKATPEAKKVLFNTYLYGTHVMAKNSSFKPDYIRCINGWLSVLPQEQIEDFVQNLDYGKDRFIQEACNKPEENEKIIRAIESVSEKTEMPDMTVYQKRISNGEIFSPSEMDDFFEKLKVIRLKTGHIPEEYCDFVIKNTIISKDKKSLKEDGEHYTMFPICVIDKTRHILKSEGIDDIIVYADNNEPAEGGAYNDRTKEINLSLNRIYALNFNIFNIVNTIFHEVQHAIQYRDINNHSLQNNSEYDMIKEQVLKSNDLFFYRMNYKSITAEIDARVAGRQRMYSYLQSLGIPIETILQGDYTYNKELYDTYNEFINEEASKLNNPNKTFIKDLTDVQTLDVLFDELIADNPKALDEYPELKREYKSDGTRKCSLEILQEYEDEIQSPDYVEPKFNLSEHLIKKSFSNSPEIEQAVMLRDAEIIKSYRPKTEKGRQLIDDIISRMHDYTFKITNQAYKINQEGHFSEGSELLNKSNIILSSLTDYVESKMLDDLFRMTQIDEMVSDEQRADALTQIHQTQYQGKNDQDKSTGLNEKQNQKAAAHNKSKDDFIDL